MPAVGGGNGVWLIGDGACVQHQQHSQSSPPPLPHTKQRKQGNNVGEVARCVYTAYISFQRDHVWSGTWKKCHNQISSVLIPVSRLTDSSLFVIQIKQSWYFTPLFPLELSRNLREVWKYSENIKTFSLLKAPYTNPNLYFTMFKLSFRFRIVHCETSRRFVDGSRVSMGTEERMGSQIRCKVLASFGALSDGSWIHYLRLCSWSFPWGFRDAIGQTHSSYDLILHLPHLMLSNWWEKWHENLIAFLTYLQNVTIFAKWICLFGLV